PSCEASRRLACRISETHRVPARADVRGHYRHDVCVTSGNPKQRQHAAGFSFLGAIGIVTLEIAGGACSGILNFFYAKRATLTDNLRSEIDFVVRAPNARTEEHDHVCRIGAEAIN